MPSWARRANARCFNQRGTMPRAPMTRPSAKAARTTSTSGARHCVPKKKCTVTSCWLFSANANRVKKMAALSSHMRYFNRLPQWGRLILAIASGLSLRLDFGGALIHRLAQRLARFEVGHALFGDVDAFAGARVAAHARRTPVDREAAETADFDPVPANQRIAHGVKNGLDGIFGVAVRELAETRGQ